MPKHLYIYNECDKPISATAEFVHLDTGQPTTQTVLVPPGNQKLLCATNQSPVSCQAVSEDGSLHWEKWSLELSAFEYTHVLTCQCPGQDRPIPWPLPTTRQHPVEEGKSQSS